MNRIMDKPVFLNLKKPENSSIAMPNIEDVPILLNAKALQEIQRDDNEPYYKVEAIEFPCEGTGGIYEKSFFKSFIDVTKNRPIPGSKRGHEFTSRPSTDFYMVGGSIVENEDKKSGVAYFKMYIPKKGDTTDNYGFMRDCRANIVHFSLVTQPEYNVRRDEDGQERRHFIRHVAYERNDAVEYGAGAMSQVVNAANASGDKVQGKSVAKAKRLIEAGNYDSSSSWSFSAADGDKMLGSEKDDWGNYASWHMVEDTTASEETKARYKYPYGKNGKVYRSALRAIASRAATADLNELSDTATELIKLIDEKRKSNGGRKMELNEAIETVGNAISNGAAKITDIAKSCGFADKMRNETDEKNAEIARYVNEKFGDKYKDKIEGMIDENKKNAEAIARAAVIEAYGNAEETIGDKKVENAAHTYAMKVCNGKTGDDLKAAIESLKNDSVMSVILASRADPFNKVNAIESNGNGDRKIIEA
jgi:hypothetical protein